MLIAGSASAQHTVFNSSRTMTSSNTPSPVTVTASSEYNASYQAWQAFDTTYNTEWITDGSGYPIWITYDCGPGNSNVLGSVLFSDNATPGWYETAFQIQGSMDNASWVDLGTGSMTAVVAQRFYTTNITTYSRYFRIYATAGINGYMRKEDIMLSSADFYSAVMTASNTPAPNNATADSQYTVYAPWYAFSCNIGSGNRFISAATPPPHWIKYTFGSNVVINGFSIYPIDAANQIDGYVLSCSTDDVSYVTIHTGNLANTNIMQHVFYTNTVPYSWYLLTITNNYPGGDGRSDFWLTYKHYPYTSPTPSAQPHQSLFRLANGTVMDVSRRTLPVSTYWNDSNVYAGLWENETTNLVATLDTSGNNYDMTNLPTVATGPTWIIVGTNQYGRVEHGYRFDGLNDLFQTRQIINGLSNWTMFAWVRREGIVSYGGIMGESWTAQGLDGLLLLGDGESIRADVHNRHVADTITGNSLALNEWIFCAARWSQDLATFSLYTNNYCISNRTTVAWPENTDAGMMIGWYNYGTRFFPGTLDCVGVMSNYNTLEALTNLFLYTHPTNNIRARP